MRLPDCKIGCCFISFLGLISHLDMIIWYTAHSITAPRIINKTAPKITCQIENINKPTERVSLKLNISEKDCKAYMTNTVQLRSNTSTWPIQLLETL